MDNQEHAMNIAALSEMFSRAEAENVALKLNMDEFAYMYRYIMHYVVLNRKSACKVLFTIKPLTVNDEKQIEGFEDFVAGPE